MHEMISCKSGLISIALCSAVLFFCHSSKRDLSTVLAEGAKIEKLGAGMQFTFLEGPAWDGKGNLFFTDIPNNRIYKYSLDGAITVFRENTNAANGLMFDHRGRLIACEGGAGRVTAMAPDGKVVEVLASQFEGKPFNSPNDLVIDKLGGIYFTDPRFGSEENMPQDKQAVYYRTSDGAIRRVIDNMTKPNGIILSPDGSTLYVVDTFDKYVKAYKVSDNGALTDEQVFAVLQLHPQAKSVKSGADGLAMDVQGNLYVTTQLGVQVINPNGRYLGIIQVPEVPANCTIGGVDGKTLFITARTGLYAIKLKVAGVQFPLR